MSPFSPPASLRLWVSMALSPYQVPAFPLPLQGSLWVGLGRGTQNHVCAVSSWPCLLPPPPGEIATSGSRADTSQVSLRLPYKAGAGCSVPGLLRCHLQMLIGSPGGGWGWKRPGWDPVEFLPESWFHPSGPLVLSHHFARPQPQFLPLPREGVVGAPVLRRWGRNPVPPRTRRGWWWGA